MGLHDQNIKYDAHHGHLETVQLDLLIYQDPAAIVEQSLLNTMHSDIFLTLRYLNVISETSVPHFFSHLHKYVKKRSTT